MTISKYFANVILLLILLSILMLVWYRRIYPPDYSITARGGADMVATNFPAQPYYLQIDPEWKDETVGGSGEPMSSVGCTVCCVSMALSHLGVPSDPKTLNINLKIHKAYTRRGLLKWNIAEKVTGNGIVFELPGKPTHAAIDNAVRAGTPVIAKILLWESIPHWVLITGKDGDEYLVKNPLCQDKVIQKLSKLSAKIQSIRIVKHPAASFPRLKRDRGAS